MQLGLAGSCLCEPVRLIGPRYPSLAPSFVGLFVYSTHQLSAGIGAGIFLCMKTLAGDLEQVGHFQSSPCCASPLVLCCVQWLMHVLQTSEYIYASSGTVLRTNHRENIRASYGGKGFGKLMPHPLLLLQVLGERACWSGCRSLERY